MSSQLPARIAARTLEGGGLEAPPDTKHPARTRAGAEAPPGIKRRQMVILLQNAQVEGAHEHGRRALAGRVLAGGEALAGGLVVALD